MKKRSHHILFLLIWYISFLTGARAQVSSPQVPETTKPTTQNNTNPISTEQSSNVIIYESTPQPAPKKRRRKVTVADSIRLAAQRDSIVRAAQGLAAQTSVNKVAPTNLAPIAMDTMLKNVIASTNSEVPILTSSDNPFDILRGGNPQTDTTLPKTKTILEQASPSLLNRETYSKNFLFWIFLITLSLMAMVVAIGRSAISDAYQALLNNNSLRHIYRLQAGWGNIAQLALYILFLVNAGIFVFLMTHRVLGKSPMNQFWTFIFCVLGVSLVFFIKHAVLYIVSLVFPITKEVKLYNFIITTSGILLGLILLPLNIFIAYSPEVLSNILTYMAFAAIGFIYLVRSLRSLSVASPFLATDQFHFFIYLCAVEFAPILILVKILISKSPN
ncbi:MAG: DUF4271 domain-containing protein [Saprospiraceae bacterium]|nr:DUF4271 domain-containing protein [Saprospiraceae bacterium]